MPIEFKRSLETRYVSNRLKHTKVHVSEVIGCIGKAFLRRVHPLKSNIESKQIWMAGLGWEKEMLGSFAQQLTYGGYDYRKKIVVEEKSGLMPSIVATLDGKGTFEKYGELGIETKFTRFNMDEPSDSYVDQCRMYSKLSGQIILLSVRSLVPKFKTDFYLVNASDKTDDFFIDMENRAKTLLQSVRDYMAKLTFDGLEINHFSDIFDLKLVPLVKPTQDWECAYCEYATHCPYAWELADLWWTTDDDVLKTRWKKRLIDTVLNGKLITD